jgi:chemosensory pili system protein ChpA (sensor histidine kinase/response regulator)
MSVLACEDIIHDFINELKDYIPSMRENSDHLMDIASEEQTADLNEFHRHVHTIRGASTLVKLDNLAKVAAELEEVLEDIIANRLKVDAEVCKVIADAINYFDTFANAVISGNEVDEACSATIIDALSGLRKSSVQNAEPNLFFNDDIAPSGHQVDDDLQDPLDLTGQALMEGFLQEAEDHFQDLGKALGALEKQISAPTEITPESKELIRLIRRSVHTVKGAAAVIQLNTIAAWGHEVEDVLDWLYEDADTITPENVEVLVDATDMLERYVTAPQKIDQRQLKLLRFAFKQMIGNGQDDPSEIGLVSSPGVAASPDDSDIIPLSEDSRPQTDDRAASLSDRHMQPPDLGQVKTLRVDMTKIESLVNLASELTIALSAFDQDMEGLGNLIGEIDRARSRLKRTARDLELGYEVKAIQQLGAAPALAAGEGEVSGFSDFDLLELDRYSELNLIIRSMGETAVDVSTISR